MNVEKIGSVSKVTKSNGVIEYSNGVTVKRSNTGNPEDDILQFSMNSRVVEKVFREIDEDFGKTTAEGLADYYALNNFFFKLSAGSLIPDIEDLENRVDDLEQKYIIGIWYEPIQITDSSDGQIGTFTIPTGASLLENSLAGETGIVYKTRNGSPIEEEVQDTDPNTTEDWIAVELVPNTDPTMADYTILGQLSSGSTPIDAAIVYQYLIPFTDYTESEDLNEIPVIGMGVNLPIGNQQGEFAVWDDTQKKWIPTGINLRFEDDVLIVDPSGVESVPDYTGIIIAQYIKDCLVLENQSQGEPFLIFKNQQAAAGVPLGMYGTSEGIGLALVNTTTGNEESGLGMIYFYCRLNDPSIDLGVGSSRFARFSRLYTNRDVSLGVGTEDLDKQPVFNVIKSDSNSPYTESWGVRDDLLDVTTEWAFVHKDGYFIYNNFQEGIILPSDPGIPVAGYFRAYATGQDLYAIFDDGTIKSLTQASANIFTPTGGDDTTAFEAYVNDQIANLQPAIYLANPTGVPILLSNLTNAPNYNKLPWIGVYSPTGSTEVEFSGNNTLLLSSGCKNIEVKLANTSQLTLQGFSEHSLYELSQVTFANGSNNSTLTFQACTCLISGRLDIQSGATGNTIHISDRSTVSAQNWDVNNGTSATFISGDANLTVNRGDGVVNVGQKPDASVTSRCRFTFNQWDAANFINVFGNFNTITGIGAAINIRLSASQNAILGINTVTDNSGNTTNEFVQQKRRIALTTVVTGYNINTDPATPIQWDTIEELNTNLASVDLGVDSTLVTFLKDAKITLGYQVNQSGDNNRINLTMYASLNDAPLDNTNTMGRLTQSHTYTRNNSSNEGQNSSYVPITMNVSTGDELKLFGLETDEAGTAQVINGWIFIEEELY